MGTVVCEGEENLLATYLHRGRTLPPEFHVLVASDGLWKALLEKREFAARKAEDRISYWWDDMIETFVADFDVRPDQGPSPSDHERIVRTMAAENRFARRTLSGACVDWLGTRTAGARNLVSPSEVGYVFATYPRDWSREHRVTNLTARCLVARSRSVMDRPTVIGLATEVYDPSGFSFDAVYLNMPEWTDEDEKRARETRERLGILSAPTVRRLSVDEFPQHASARSERNRAKRERRSRRGK